MSVRDILLIGLAAVAALLIIVWATVAGARRTALRASPAEAAAGLGIGFVTDFFDTLGVGSFAVTTAFLKFFSYTRFFRPVPDERIPGTLNVGHTLPTIVEALLFIAIVGVAPVTLVSLIIASILGAWLGAGVVARLPRRAVQVGMGILLLAAAAVFLANILTCHSSSGYCGGHALSLSGVRFWVGVVAMFVLGALMTIGIGLYAPAMILVGLLGMDPLAAWPIMMGSCAFLMPFASIRFIRFDAYTLRSALGLTLGGIPGVLVAFYFIKQLPSQAVHWLVIAVVMLAAALMLGSAVSGKAAEADGLVTP